MRSKVNLFVILLLLLLAACQSQAQNSTPTAAIAPTTAASSVNIQGVTADKIKWPDLGGKEINIAVENGYPPYNFLDPKNNNQPGGWDYDTFTEICQLINCKPVFKETGWDGMLIAISNGEFDVAADGITYTPERAQSVSFSQLYQAYDETLLVRADETRFTTSEELKAIPSFLVSTQVGTTDEITAKKLFGDDHVKSFKDFGAAVQALLDDDVDAVDVDRPAAEGYITTKGNMKTLAELLNGIEGLAFAFPKGSDLVNPVNAAMSALQASGTWDELYKKWFIDYKPS